MILAFGIVNTIIQVGVQRISAVVGLLFGISLVAKGVRGLGGTGLWRAPWLAFYSGAFYDDVGRRTQGVGALYLLALEAAMWLLFIVAGYVAFQGFVANDGRRAIAQLPPITIRQGKVHVDAVQPHYIRFEGEKTAMALDTTGQIASLEKRPDLMLLLAQDKLHMRQTSGAIRIHDLSKTQSFDLNQTILQSWLERYTVPFFGVGYLLAVLGAFGYRLVQALLYAAIGLGFGRIFGKTLSYGASLRLAIAAVTPIVLIDTILGLAKVSAAAGFLWWLVCLGTTLGFLAFGVKSLSEA